MTALIAFGLISENRKEPAVIGPQCPNANVCFGSFAEVDHTPKPAVQTAAFGEKADHQVSNIDPDLPLGQSLLGIAASNNPTMIFQQRLFPVKI